MRTAAAAAEHLLHHVALHLELELGGRHLEQRQEPHQQKVEHPHLARNVPTPSGDAAGLPAKT